MEFKYEGKSLKSGVYKITNTQNGRIYIGSAKEFKVRWKQHKNSLLNNKHSNKFLQNDFNKCGESVFVFEVLEVVDGDKEQRTFIEQKYLKQCFDNQKQCYNIKKETKQKETTYRHTPETKQKLSEQAKKKIGAANPNWGNHWTSEMKTLLALKVRERCSNPDYRIKLSKAQKNKRLTNEQKETANLKRSVASKRLFLDPSYREKVLSGLKKNQINKRRGVEQYKNEILIATFSSLTEAQEKTGIYYVNISNCCRGKQKTAGGFIWRYQ